MKRDERVVATQRVMRWDERMMETNSRDSSGKVLSTPTVDSGTHQARPPLKDFSISTLSSIIHPSLSSTKTTMGRLRHKRTHHARRDVQRGARTRARTKDLDQIQHDIDHSRKKLERQPIDEDKPGLGQHVSGIGREGDQ